MIIRITPDVVGMRSPSVANRLEHSLINNTLLRWSGNFIAEGIDALDRDQLSDELRRALTELVMFRSELHRDMSLVSVYELFVQEFGMQVATCAKEVLELSRRNEKSAERWASSCCDTSEKLSDWIVEVLEAVSRHNCNSTEIAKFWVCMQDTARQLREILRQFPRELIIDSDPHGTTDHPGH